MLFKQVDIMRRHNEDRIWYLYRNGNEDIRAKWSPIHNAYDCDVSTTTYNNQWEETGYKVESALLTDADLGDAEVIEI